MLNLTRLHLGTAHESQFQGLGIRRTLTAQALGFTWIGYPRVRHASRRSVAWPLAARAQRAALPAIGYLYLGSPEHTARQVAAFRLGLSETGYVEGHNVAIEYRWAEGHYDRLPALAADLVHRQVAEIVTGGTPPAFAAKRATSTIPIVVNVGINPVQVGLVASLNRPGGNVTGLALLTVELAAKRLELLHELLGTATVVAMLVNPTTPLTEPETRGVRDAARSLGLQMQIGLVASNGAPLAWLPSRCRGLLNPPNRRIAPAAKAKSTLPSGPLSSCAPARSSSASTCFSITSALKS